jgi:hypothetical protein
MLRTKSVEVAGQKFTIGNLTLGVQRRFNEGLDRIRADPRKAVESGITMQALYQEILIASLRRVDPAVTIDALDALDLDDLVGLFNAVVAWTGDVLGKESDAGEMPSP